MAQHTRMQVLNEIYRIGVIPVFYNADFETAKKIVTACYEGGAQVIEFTNRGDNAYKVFSNLVEYFSKEIPQVILGTGSVGDPGTGAIFMASGANFIVGSLFNPELAKACNRRKVPYCPGCGSASEIALAEEYGTEIVKVFPGDSVGGPNFVKSILGPTPWTRLMPTGGVEATQESITAWFKAGVAAVGIGSNLIRKNWVNSGDYAAIRDLAAQCLCWANAARGVPLFTGLEHVGLYPAAGSDGTALAEWYRTTFGFSLMEGRSSIFVEGQGAGRIEVAKVPAEAACHVAISVSDFEAACDALRKQGLELEEPNLKPTSKAVYLRQPDPAGNRVHLIWRRA